jgi:DNA-binding PadR family transcriptional regulator
MFGRNRNPNQNPDWSAWAGPWFREEWQQGGRGPSFRMRRGRGPFGGQGPFGGGPFGPGAIPPVPPIPPMPPEGFEGRNRFFGRGDVKFALLELLAERPMHGYEMMKALEAKSAGFYVPSAGTIYPTLQLLEDRELVTSSDTNGKKVYQITEAGKTMLTQRQAEGDSSEDFQAGAPWQQFFNRGGHHAGKHAQNMNEWRTIKGEIKELTRLITIATRMAFNNPAQLQRLREIMNQTSVSLAEMIQNPLREYMNETQAADAGKNPAQAAAPATTEWPKPETGTETTEAKPTEA